MESFDFLPNTQYFRLSWVSFSFNVPLSCHMTVQLETHVLGLSVTGMVDLLRITGGRVEDFSMVLLD